MTSHYNMFLSAITGYRIRSLPLPFVCCAMQERANPSVPGTDLNEKYGLNYCIGGYLEERGMLFESDSGEKLYHLGVDAYLPPGSHVHSPCAMEVVSVENGISGGTIICRPWDQENVPYILFSHMKDIHLKPGDLVSDGFTLGLVANEHPFPHVHIQCIPRAFYKHATEHNKHNPMFPITMSEYAISPDIIEMSSCDPFSVVLEAPAGDDSDYICPGCGNTYDGNAQCICNSEPYDA